MSSCYLSVVIPAYNEARRLPETLTTLNGYLGSRSYTWEVIVADDGSEDATPAIVHGNSRRPTRVSTCIPSRTGVRARR